MSLISNPKYLDTFYEPETGLFWRKDKNDLIQPKPLQFYDRRISVCLSSTGKYTWKGAGNLAWEFITSTPVPDNHLIYYKNSDNEDFRSENLGIIHKSELKSLRDAMLNLQGHLKILPNKMEVYTYKVRYKEGGGIKHKCFQDCIAANDFYKEIKARSVRELGKYAVTQ